VRTVLEFGCVTGVVTAFLWCLNICGRECAVLL